MFIKSSLNAQSTYLQFASALDICSIKHRCLSTRAGNEKTKLVNNLQDQVRCVGDFKLGKATKYLDMCSLIRTMDRRV